MANKDRVTFGSKIGVILATVGCAVGLGSIWRFPYICLLYTSDAADD